MRLRLLFTAALSFASFSVSAAHAEEMESKLEGNTSGERTGHWRGPAESYFRNQLLGAGADHVTVSAVHEGGDVVEHTGRVAAVEGYHAELRLVGKGAAKQGKVMIPYSRIVGVRSATNPTDMRSLFGSGAVARKNLVPRR